MSLPHVFSWWRRRGRSRSAAGAKRRPTPPARVRPQLEYLEDRRVLTAFANQAYVAALYRGLLDRDPEQAGLNLWSGFLNSGQSFTQVAGGIVSSAEYRFRQIEDVYEHALNRQADPLGMAIWSGLLQQGQTLEQVKAGIYASNEFFTRAGGTPQGFLNVLFQNELRRSPNAGELTLLGTNLTTQGQREAVALEVLSGTEAEQVKVANYYRGILVRNVDPLGLSFWTNELSTGASDEAVMAGILGSAEFFQRLQNAINLAPGTDPVQVGDAFARSTNQLSGSVVGVPSPSSGTANATQVVSFSITPIGTPFGPLRFAVLSPAVLAPTPLTAGFTPATQQPLLPGVSATQNIAPGFSALATGVTALAPGITTLPGTNAATATAIIAPGFTQVTTTPFAGNIAPGLTPVFGVPTMIIAPGFTQTTIAPGSGFGSVIPTPTVTSSPVFI